MSHLIPHSLLRLGILATLFILPASQPSALAATAQALPDNPSMIELKNDWLTVRIDLARGSRVASFLYKGFDNQDVVFDYAAGNGGLCKDLWTVQGWPGEFDRRKFDSQIVSSGPNEVILKTSTTSTGIVKNQPNETLSDLLLTKTFSLRQGDRALHLKVEITNKGSKGKRPAYWFQNALDFDGERKNNLYWRPTRHAVDMISQDVNSEYGYWYVAIPRAGWCGVTQAKLKRGLMFLMDYNSTQQLYDNGAANTVEWMYEDTAIPVGKTWVTEITLIPTEGYAGYRHGDRDLVAHFETTETPAGLLVDHVLSAASAPLKDVTVKTRVIGAKDSWTAEAEPFTVPELGFAPLTRQVPVAGIGAMPCVIQVTVTGTDAQGKSKTISYEDYYGGKAGRNLNLELLQPYYEFTAPPKIRQYLKPDDIKLQANAKPRILFVRGLWAEFQGVDEALKKMGNVEVVDAWMKQAALGETLGNFPASYDELLSYNAIILANVSGGMLGDLGQEMLADFAKAGGGLLFLSGDRAYGQAGFSNPNFTSLLPVTFKSGGDYARLAKPSPLQVSADHPLVKGLAFPASAVVLYAHELASTNQAVPLLAYSDGRPAAVASAPGKPRVVLVTALPFGKDPAGMKLYFKDQVWQEFLSRSLDWLIKGDKK
jgi:uncharacterized membrane protein